MNKKIKVLFLILTILISLFLIYKISETYALFYSESEGRVSEKLGNWTIKVNNKDVSNGIIEQFNVEQLKLESDQNVKEGKIAPGLEGSFSITIDPTDTDVSIRYDIVFDMSLLNTENIKLAKVEKVDSEELVKTGENTYRVATVAEASEEGFTSAKVVAGSITIKGLDDDASYYLEETVAPDGYNKLTSRVEVRLTGTIAADNTSSVVVSGAESTTVEYAQDTVSIINITGSLLPTTGGMGTILFVTIGSVLVLGFGVLLVTKLRMSKTVL